MALYNVLLSCFLAVLQDCSVAAVVGIAAGTVLRITVAP